MNFIGLTSADLTIMAFTVALVVSLNVIAGLARHLVFCQAAFYGAGAYTVAILSAEHHVSFWPAMLAAAAVAAGAGILVGLPVLRVSSLYFAMMTYAAGFVAQDVAYNSGFTGGTIGIGPTPVASVFGVQLLTPVTFSIAAWLVVLASEVVIVVLSRSHAGWAMRAIGADSKVADVVGAGQKYVLAAFVVSAAAAGIAGGLFAYYIVEVNAGSFGVSLSLILAVALLVGGLGSIAGSLVSGILVAYVQVRLIGFPYTAQLIFGAFLVLVIYVQPDGLLPPRRERALARWVMAHAARGRGRGRVSPAATGGTGGAGGTGGTAAGGAPGAARAVGHLRRHDGAGRLSARHLRKAFGGVRALDDVSFDLASGECLGVIGPNGAGKSTLLDIISGFTMPDSGSVHAGGVDLLGLPARGRVGAGVCRTFQAPRLLLQESVYENIALGTFPWNRRPLLGHCSGSHVPAQAQELVMDILAMLGLEQQRQSFAADLPYGQQKIVEIGRALAAGPRFLLLDEPLSGLDAGESQRMADVIQQVSRVNVGIVLIEHDLGVVAQICDRVLALHHGATVAHGSVEDVYRSPSVRRAYFGPQAVGGS
jgi:branched-chain amino acid transport system ATP-binding protein